MMQNSAHLSTLFPEGLNQIVCSISDKYVAAFTRGENPLRRMTSLSAYMRAERLDTSEPASFYVPGAVDWNDPRLRALMGLRRVAKASDDPLYPAPLAEDSEIEEL